MQTFVICVFWDEMEGATMRKRGKLLVFWPNPVIPPQSQGILVWQAEGVNHAEEIPFVWHNLLFFQRLLPRIRRMCRTRSGSNVLNMYFGTSSNFWQALADLRLYLDIADRTVILFHSLSNAVKFSTSKIILKVTLWILQRLNLLVLSFFRFYKICICSLFDLKYLQDLYFLSFLICWFLLVNFFPTLYSAGNAGMLFSHDFVFSAEASNTTLAKH